MNICLYTGVKKHLNSIQRIFTPVPAHSNCAAIFLADCRQFRSHSVAGCCKVRNNVILSADFQQFFKTFMLIRVSTSPECKLIYLMFTLLRNPPEVFNRHIGLFDCQSALVATDAGLHTQPCTPVNTMPHHTHINEIGEGSHKRVFFCFLPVLIDDTGSQISACFRVEYGIKSVFMINLSQYHIITL